MNVHRWSEMCDGEFYEVVLAEDYDAITVEMEKDKDLITRLRHEIDIQKKNWFALFDEAKKVPGLEEKIEALEKQLAESTAKVAELKADTVDGWSSLIPEEKKYVLDIIANLLRS